MSAINSYISISIVSWWQHHYYPLSGGSTQIARWTTLLVHTDGTLMAIGLCGHFAPQLLS